MTCQCDHRHCRDSDPGCTAVRRAIGVVWAEMTDRFRLVDAKRHSRLCHDPLRHNMLHPFSKRLAKSATVFSRGLACGRTPSDGESRPSSHDPPSAPETARCYADGPAPVPLPTRAASLKVLDYFAYWRFFLRSFSRESAHAPQTLRSVQVRPAGDALRPLKWQAVRAWCGETNG
jgi:hypothetical protein